MYNKIVIDTNWKEIDQTKPADDDLKQMNAYNKDWDSELSMLLYPSRHQARS